jgi:glyoxylase-like metal-dependent hydrolase (beta-lactamase superfamily II)
MTYWGTNTYMIGKGAVAVIDPGPKDSRHLDAILSALSPGESISHIFVTHAHLDHSALAPDLARATGAPVLAFGPAQAGRSARMQALAQEITLTGGEGVDTGFRPDRCLADAEVVTADSWSLEAIHTPGHMANHLCFAWGNTLFSADHVMGWASSLVSPPDGDMGDYIGSLRRLSARDWHVALPGHGAPIEDPSARIAELIAHRADREAAILSALSKAPSRIPDLVEHLYSETPRALFPAASRNVFAHLLQLHDEGRVTAAPRATPDALYGLP